MPAQPISTPSIVEIQGVVQKYAWGKRGNSSRVGVLSGECTDHPETPFAEMWFGAHPSYPSPILSTNHQQSEGLTKDLFQFVTSPRSSLKSPLPFLMKVLSVGAPLSIQLHPNKGDAERLHHQDPKHYPDANHKPELAVALTEVELVCGIRPLTELTQIASIIPALKTITTPNTLEEDGSEKAVEIFRTLFNLSEIEREKIVDDILKSESNDPLLEHHLRWVRAAATKSSRSDPGLIGILLLNHIALSPGECVYIAPGIPHAYMTGDLVECMASSDNVVRAGLTEKFIDITTFIELVQYEPLTNPRLRALASTDGRITSFKPPVPDFKLTRIKDCSLDLSPVVKAPSIIMCQSGEALVTQGQEKLVWTLQQGAALFVSHLESPLHLSGTGADVFIASSNDS